MIEEKVFDLIKKEFDVDEVTREMSLVDDFNLDSLSALELVMDIEDEFDVEIEDEDLAKLITVGDFIDYLEDKADE